MPKKTKTTTTEAQEAARLFGQLGGRSGTGKAKKRGTKAFYRELGRKGGLAKNRNAQDETKG